MKFFQTDDGAQSGGVVGGGASDYLVSPTHLVSEDSRAIANGHRGAVFWLTGLPASGKSTLAMALERVLFQRGRQVFVLDADTLRQGVCRDLGFSPEDRSEGTRRAAEIAKLFASAGMVVIVAMISPYRKDRDYARRLIGPRFHEVHVMADQQTCEKRDPKGLYRAYRAGRLANVTGIDAPYEAPQRPELVIDTNQQTIEQSLKALIGLVDGTTPVQISADAWAI